VVEVKARLKDRQKKKKKRGKERDIDVINRPTGVYLDLQLERQTAKCANTHTHTGRQIKKARWRHTHRKGQTYIQTEDDRK